MSFALSKARTFIMFTIAVSIIGALGLSSRPASAQDKPQEKFAQDNITALRNWTYSLALQAATYGGDGPVPERREQV
jgi:hypothetical protein